MKKFFTLIAAALMTLCASAQTTTVGSEDNSTAWWSAFSDYYTLKEGQKAHITFTDYSAKVDNWDNWVLVTNVAGTQRGQEGVYAEYAVWRVDNYGWGDYYDASLLKCDYNWDNFKSDMDGSNVVIDLYSTDGKIHGIAAVTTAAGKTYHYSFYSKAITAKDFGFFLTCEKAHLTNLNVTISDLKCYLKATPAEKYALNSDITAGFYEYDDAVLIKAFDGVADNDLLLTWDANGWNGINNDSIYTTSIGNSASYAKAALSAKKMSGNWTSTDGGTFYIGGTFYATAEATEGETAYLYYMLTDTTTKAAPKLVKTLKAVTSDYSEDYKTYVSEADGIIKGYETTVEVYDDGTYVIKDWLGTKGYDLKLGTNAGYFKSVNGVVGSGAYADFKDGGKQIYIYAGSYSWYTSQWIYLSCYYADGYITIYYSLTDPTGINNVVAAPAAKTSKVLENGQLVIKKGDKKYTAAGAMLK